MISHKTHYFCITERLYFYIIEKKMVAEYNSVYDELAFFLASLSPRRVISYKSSVKAQERVNLLLEKNKVEGLTSDENSEMERFMTVEHIVRLAKAKALQKLNS
jgi:hypothetical protein